jgi:hypothetical protein
VKAAIRVGLSPAVLCFNPSHAGSEAGDRGGGPAAGEGEAPDAAVPRAAAPLALPRADAAAYVGVELRRLGDLVEQGGSKAAPTPEETALAGLEVRGPVLVIGRRGQKAGLSLTSRGYDVTQVDVLEDWDAGGRRFGAVLYMRDASETEAADLQRIAELLSQDGALVMGVASGMGSNGSASG